MKKRLFCLLMIIFIFGCSENKGEKKYQGVSAQKDYDAIGMQYLSEENLPDAIKSFDQAIRLDPQNPAKYITLGQVYLGLKNYDRAIDTFSAAVRVAPKNADVFYFLAMSRALRNKNQDADLAIASVKKSAELFVAEKNKKGFIKAMALYKNLTGEDLMPQKTETENKTQ